MTLLTLPISLKMPAFTCKKVHLSSHFFLNSFCLYKYSLFRIQDKSDDRIEEIGVQAAEEATEESADDIHPAVKCRLIAAKIWENKLKDVASIGEKISSTF